MCLLLTIALEIALRIGVNLTRSSRSADPTNGLAGAGVAAGVDAGAGVAAGADAVGASTATGAAGAATGAPPKLSMSSRVTRPPLPVGTTAVISTPFSRAY